MRLGREGSNNSYLSIIIGFMVLFLLYHLPEFFQRYYNKPLLWLLELGMLIFVIVAYYIGLKQKGIGLQAFGLKGFGFYKRNLFIGLGVGIFLVALSTCITAAVGWNKLVISGSIGQMILTTIIFIFGTSLPSLAEDILVRGYLFAHWPKKSNKIYLTIFSAALFSLNHIYRLNRPDVMIYIFLLGLITMTCLVATNTLWLTFGIHWGTNIGYQFFNNVLSVQTVKETGYDNYILAFCYLIGLLGIGLVLKTNLVKTLHIK
jgi:uncharacterized protein